MAKLPFVARAILFSLFCFLTTFCVAADRPNILFIMSDDHGYQAIGAYGSIVNKTPNLDRIAKEGMRFDRCFVTNSICGPCRATILTGKYSHLNGFARNGDRFNGKQQNVAKILQKSGYQTAVVGKWHLATEPTGFDYWHVLQGQGPYYNPRMKTTDGLVSHTGYTTDIITDEALKWLKTKRDAEKPFFLMYQHKAPHRNWQPGPKHLNTFDDVEIPEPKTLYDDYSNRASPASTQAMTVANHLSDHDLKLSKQRATFTPEQKKAWDDAYEPKNKTFRELDLKGKDLVKWKYQRYAKDYLRCVQSVDDNVGRVLDYLKESGLEENTVVIYTSDQGWYLGEHGWYDKRWMYEESFRTPLMIRWPSKIKPGSTNTDMVMNLDFAQTFLDIAGIESPKDMQGRSFKPLLEGKTPADWRKTAYYHYYEFPGAHSVRRHFGVRSERYKLIHFYKIDEWEFFDLEKDPDELNSVYNDPSYKERVAEHKAELKRLQTLYKDDGESIINFGAADAANVRQKQVAQFAKKITAIEGKAIATLQSNNKNDPTYKPFTIGGWVTTENPNGVIIAHGGESQGYSLYLDKGKPTLVVRHNGVMHKVAADQVVDFKQWKHVTAKIDADATASIMIDGEMVARQEKFSFVGNRPADGISVGMDSGSFVSDYENGNALDGKLKDIRIFWQTPRAKQKANWTKSPVKKKLKKADFDKGASLFNGKNFDGIHVIKERFYSDAGKVEVVDGTIQLGKGDPGTGIRFDYEAIPKINYEMELTARRVEGDDFFCGLTFPVKEKHCTLILGGWGGKVTGLSNLDSFAAIENGTTDVFEFEQKKWYKVKLKVTEKVIQAWIDEKQIVDIETGNHKFSIWWEQEPASPLGITSWNTKSQLKELKLKKIK